MQTIQQKTSYQKTITADSAVNPTGYHYASARKMMSLETIAKNAKIDESFI